MELRGSALVALTLFATACGDVQGPAITPNEGPASGYYAIRIDDAFIRAEDVLDVMFGEQDAFAVRPLGPNAFEVMVQGAPSPGPSTITVTTTTRRKLLASGFEYEAPNNAHFERMVAVGASLSQGVQNGVPTLHGGLMSPPAQLARQLGGYFPLPLLIEDFLPEITADDIGPAPACEPPDIVAHVTESALAALTILSEGYDKARVDPDIEVRNLAVGGAKVRSVLQGPDEEDFAGNFMGRLVLEPYTIGPVQRSQLEYAEDLEPTLIVSMDLFGNDAAASLLQGDTIDPTLLTPLADFEADMAIIVDRLAATSAEVFLANMPRASILPLTDAKRSRMIQAAIDKANEDGEDPDIAAAFASSQADAGILQTEQRIEEMNAVLADLAAQRPNVHVVDLAARVEELAAEGLLVTDQQLTTQKFGGLLSLDGVHFTDTGYAMVANAFVEAINAELGTAVAPIDLAAVLTNDPGSPAALAKAGLEVSLCDR